jgi:opacity protein-like surface antigen
VRMSIFAGRLGLAVVVAALCLGGRTAHAQTAPVTYWLPNWPIGFGGNLTGDQGSNTYGNFPSFDGSDVRGDRFSTMRYNFANGWFVGREGGGIGLGMNGINRDGAFSNIPSLYYEGLQFGYTFQNSGMPLKIYAGFDTLKYNVGSGGALAPLDAMSGTLPGYGAHAGVEFQPVPNLSLSLGVGFTQSGRIDGESNSALLPGASPFAFGARR